MTINRNVNECVCECEWEFCLLAIRQVMLIAFSAIRGSRRGRVLMQALRLLVRSAGDALKFWEPSCGALRLPAQRTNRSLAVTEMRRNLSPVDDSVSKYAVTFRMGCVFGEFYRNSPCCWVFVRTSSGSSL